MIDTDDSIMDIDELIEILSSLPGDSRVLLLKDKPVPVSRLIRVGFYNLATEEFEEDFSLAKQGALVSICFCPRIDD